MSAVNILEKAAGHLKGRAATYDNPTQQQVGGDHYTKLAIQPMQYSMANGLNALQHTIIKYVTRYKDKGGIEDLHKAAHCVELLIQHEMDDAHKRTGWTPEAINAAAFKDAYKEYILQEVIGDAELSDWARWVTVDKDGDVYEYSKRPHICNHAGQWDIDFGDWNCIRKINPPSDFTKCIWEAKK